MSTLELLNKQFPCPGCGSTLEFNPKLGRLSCPYCGREEDVPESDQQVIERSFDEFVNADQTQIAVLSSTAQEVDCPGCKARLTFEPPDVAGSCPFCNTHIVAQPHSASPVITPEALLPFSITQREARSRVQRWLGSRWFAPNGLKRLAQQETIQGVYLPFWTYDSQTNSHYSGERGTHYYKTETYTERNSEGKLETKTRQVRHTRWQPVSGYVSRNFDDVLIPAAETIALQRLESLEPWDLSRLVPYQSSYLAGFKAQRYQVDLSRGLESAKQKMAGVIRSDVVRDIGGDEQRVHSISTTHHNVTFKHILLPVWISAYRFNNKRYQVIVNAQTGEVLGDRPFSFAKIAAAVVAATLLMLGLAWGYEILNPPSEPTDSSPPTTNPVPRSPTQPPSPVPLPLTPSPASSNPFRDAVNAAGRAASFTQTAQTQAEWALVATFWTQAITLMQAVPPTDPNYNIAQQKVPEYQRNLSYAQERIRLSQP